MNGQWNHNKLEELCDFIIEVIKGNFTLQLNPANSGFLEPLIKLLNIMNEELNTLFHHTHSEKSYPQVNLITLFINLNLDIKYISSQSLKYLELEHEPKNLKAIISEKSFLKLEKLFKTLNKNFAKKKLKLDFLNGKGLLFKTQAELHLKNDRVGENEILINAYKIVYQNDRLEKYRKRVHSKKIKYPTRNRSILLQANRELIEKIHTYLLENIDQKFPGMEGLATIFRVSESKIKKGFKHYYGTSIYKFLQEKRLEKAHLLLTETERPISAIAQECGFVSPSHFSRSFKKRFGYSPSDVHRNPK
ncbi:hypothetical protein C7S20_02590 [Christiangramia fulva]|uniref:HTH araC/xylS-type domain-containing protein n=1 Tax=Christiangramia fulva TaxID=2126553 RepID=A0A2R3Z1U0_9FLAO|nr:AraC family transcriptional regulator [Christiangramia fulva]AVR44237.1 hypothetical protein C7S20_02590 [Christiangramia fulva]